MKTLVSIITLLLLIYCSPKENLRPIPTAFFTWKNVGEGIVQFNNESTEADKYEWNFGDGSAVSTEQSPKHAFDSNTKHVVTLTVTNPTASNKMTQNVEVATIKPLIEFTWTDSDGQVKFTNATKNADAYTWDFGNGKTSSEVNPTTRYTKAGSYTVKLLAKGTGGESTKVTSLSISSVLLELTDAVDDPSLVNYLPGTWGAYVKGEGAKFDNYTYTFSPKNNTLSYQNYYHPYVYPSSGYQTARLDYKYNIIDKIIYVEDAAGKQSKHARIQIVSDDEMKVIRIIETGNSYSELLPNTFTRTSNLEKATNTVVKSQSLLPILKGVWDQGSYSVYKDVFFDFSYDKNYYTYNTTLQDTKTVKKKEYKVDANNIMSYRDWNTDFDPGWKKYKIEIISGTLIKLYLVDTNGTVSSNAEYTLTKRN